MAPTKANIMPRGIGHIRRPCERIVDIRDDFGTKVFRGVQDPYEVGGPRANSEYLSAQDLPQALTPAPGPHGNSPVARSSRGNTVVSMPVPEVPEEAPPPREPSFAEIVEQYLPAPPMPDFSSIELARADLMDALDKLGHRTDDVAQIGIDMTRDAFYDTIHAIEQPFVAWKEHILDLVVASAAYRAGRECEIATNFKGLDDDWGSGSLTGTRDPIEIGLDQQIDNLIDTMATLLGAIIPPLRPSDRGKWEERDLSAHQLISNIQLDIVKTTSHIIEEIESKRIGKNAARLAKLLYNQSRGLLTPDNHLYNRRAVSLALHRMLPALKGAQHANARKTVALAYHNLIGADDSEQNESLIRSYGNLVMNASDGMIHSARMILKPSVGMLGDVVAHGESLGIQNAARNTQAIISMKLNKIGI